MDNECDIKAKGNERKNKDIDKAAIEEKILNLLLLGKTSYQQYVTLSEEEQIKLFHNVDFEYIPLLIKYSSLIQKDLHEKSETELSQEYGLSIKLLKILKHNSTHDDKMSYFHISNGI
jgi:hypothetical protein